VRFQEPVHFGEGRSEPSVVGVVGDGGAGAGQVAGDVRRIGQDEIDAVRGHPAHEVDAVALQDGVRNGRRPGAVRSS
jgi:hypothetical protein